MTFPERSPAEDSDPDSATTRLAAARDEQRRLATEASAAVGTADEHETEWRLSAATAEVAAREAWVEWSERGV